jgi:transposase
MGRRDARRLGMVKAAEHGRVTNREAAQGLGLSARQFRRLRKQVRERGESGVIHGNRGRPSPRRLSSETRERVVALLTGAVKLNDHHLAEWLAEAETPVTVSPASVRRIRGELKLAPKRLRRPPRHRRRRARKARRGEMVLIDGSPFQWFDAQGPAWSLMGAIDDATSEILCLTLRPTEDLHGYVTLLRDVIHSHGVPACLYGDRSGILVRNDRHWSLAEELRGEQDPTQFGRMLGELAVDFIPARSPQAKGRIERLWATLQDRLAAELRLLGHTTLAATQAYLPRFIAQHNRKRAVPPAESTTAFRSAPRDLDRVLACAYERVVARDNTISLPGRWAQLPPGAYRSSWHKARVQVLELLDGRLLVLHPRLGLIHEQPAPTDNFVLEHRRSPRTKRKEGSERHRLEVQAPTRRKKIRRGNLTNVRIHDKDHPWRKKFSPQAPSGPKPRRGEVRITDALRGQNH